MTTEPLIITNATVCDVRAGTLVPDQSVVAVDGRIREIDGSARTPEGARTLDAKGMVVTPGLIDGHVHVTASTADLGAQAEHSPFYVAAHSARILRGMLHRGFTTVRDVGGADYGLAAAVDEGLVEGPRIAFGGKALSPTGGHADMRGPGRSVLDDNACCPGIGLVCDGVDAVRRGARNQLRTGAHHVKIMLSGGVASPTDRIDSLQFSDDEITAVVQETAAANRYVAGHAYTARAVNRGVRLGVRSIEHGNLIDDESVSLFVQHEAFLVPTLVTYEYLKREGPAAGLPPASQQKVEVVLEAGLAALERAWRGGVKIVFGTDLLGAMHPYQSEEFRIRGQVQPAKDVLGAATTVAADLLDMTDEIGVVQVGARADLLVVDGNPLEDIGVFAHPQRHLRAVVQGGRVVTETAAG